MRSGAPATYPIAKETRYDNRKDLLPPPQRGGLVRLDRLRRAGDLHGWVQLPHQEKTGGTIACGIVALVLAAAMLYGAVALGSVQHAITDVADKSVETDITCVIVNADDPAQSLDDVKGYRFGILEDRDTENTQSLLQQLRG